jgi:hypothetical protein
MGQPAFLLSHEDASRFYHKFPRKCSSAKRFIWSEKAPPGKSLAEIHWGSPCSRKKKYAALAFDFSQGPAVSRVQKKIVLSLQSERSFLCFRGDYVFLRGMISSCSLLLSYQWLYMAKAHCKGRWETSARAQRTRCAGMIERWRDGLEMVRRWSISSWRRARERCTPYFSEQAGSRRRRLKNTFGRKSATGE